jgi:hypothetical protein
MTISLKFMCRWFTTKPACLLFCWLVDICMETVGMFGVITCPFFQIKN